jgi:CheY-like chemotaxis protein
MSADTRETLCELLAAQGFAPLSAKDGGAALALLLVLPYDEHRPDAILLDLRMPRVDGWAFLQELRANRYLREIPVLVITAADDERVPADTAGRFKKPVDRAARLTAVSPLCSA